MERFPIIITAGAALLGWLAGEMMLTDPAIHGWFGEIPDAWIAAGVIGAVLVVLVGKWLQRRGKQPRLWPGARQRVTDAARTQLRRSPG